MRERLLELFRPDGCKHQFSWPRTSPEGYSYQACLSCGAEYEYDWSRMRRLRRIEADSKPEARRERWRPRARRLKTSVPLKYRVLGSEEWQEGQAENISRSGLMFRGQRAVQVNQRLEMMVAMPEEICGREGGEVIAVGCVVRASVTAETGELELAANIWDYTFVSQVKAESRPTVEGPSAAAKAGHL